MMKLAIFDIDGTLTATSKADEACYVQALSEVHDLKVADDDWSQFKNYTDSGIFAEVFEQARGRMPTSDEIFTVQATFIEKLKVAQKKSPEAFAEVPGAREMIMKLHPKGDWSVALATGCWRASAELKLKFANMDIDAVPLATSDDYHQREDIMLDALSQAKKAYRIANFDRVVYIGDGIWDARGSRQLGFSFVGIQNEGHHKTLENEGASHLFSDYLNLQDFFVALETATPPGRFDSGKSFAS